MLFSRHEFSPGDRVVVVAWSLRGLHGTLIRKTRLPWNGRRGWIVELDGSHPPGGKKQPLGESILLPEQSLEEPSGE